MPDRNTKSPSTEGEYNFASIDYFANSCIAAPVTKISLLFTFEKLTLLNNNNQNE